MATIVLDTHALVWWVQSPELLSPNALAAIETATRLAVSTISFWEIALLVRKERLDVGMPVASWVEDVCSIDRITPIPMSVRIAVGADALVMHPDPADRFIVATTQEAMAPLVTRDNALRGLGFVETIW